MDLIESLQEDHREALRRLDGIEPAFTGALDDQGRVVPDAVASVERQWNWFRTDLLVHFRREEEALFPAAGDLREIMEGPVAQMRAEHREFEDLRAQIVGALDTIRHGCCGKDEGAARLRRAGAGLCALLREHIWKEDNILFPMLRRDLPPDRLEEAGVRAESIVLAGSAA